MKQPLKEMLVKIGGGHLLNENSQKIAKQIKSAAKSNQFLKIWPLKSMASDIKGDITGGKARNELKSKLSKVDKDSWYVQTVELGGFIVFSDGSIYEVVSDQGGDITANVSKNWKSDIRVHNKHLQ